MQQTVGLSTLSTQGLKALLQKVIDQKGQEDIRPSKTMAPAPLQIEKEPDEIIAPKIAPEPEIVAVAAIQAVDAEPENLVPLAPVITEEIILEDVGDASRIMPPDVTEEPIKESKIAEKNKQIAALKKTIKELETRKTAQEKALSKQEELQTKLKQDLEKAKQLVAEFSKRCKDLEKNQEVKSAEHQENWQQTRHEIEQYKTAVATLTKSLQQARFDAQKTENALAQKIQATTLDTQETKGRLLRLISDKKELEDRVTSLSCEKATLTARLQNLSEKGIKLEEATCALETASQKLSATQEKLTEELIQEQTQSKERQTKNEELLARLEEMQEKLQSQSRLALEAQSKNSELTEQLEANKISYSQELAVCQACLQEQSHVLADEQKKLRLLSQEHLFIQKRAEEQENHLRLLEQHLARRVKECALLSKQLEDLMDRTSHLQSSLTASSEQVSTLEEKLNDAKKLENSLRIELDSQANSYQDALQSKDDELACLTESLQRKELELSQLRQVQNQFYELEDLVKRSAAIFSSPEQPQEKLVQTPVQLSQKDFFSFSSTPKPQPKSLFE